MQRRSLSESVMRFVGRWNVGARRTTSARGRRAIIQAESLEARRLLSASFDLIGVTALRADPAFAGIDGSGVSVAIIDTGVDFTHPLLQPGFVAGQDIVRGGNFPTPVNEHGTHVAGIVGARNLEIGVAPDVGLIGLQVFTPSDNGRPLTNWTDTESALEWVLANREQYNIVAVNMSLGAGNFTSAAEMAGHILLDDVQRLEAAGVTVVSAAGNSYADLQTPGSAAPGIFSTLDVGAVYEKDEGPYEGGTARDNTSGPDRITVFSQRPNTTNNVIFAPGAMILSTIPDNQYAAFPGTSMAAPMVAGVVALLQEAAQQFGGRLLTPDEVRQVIQGTADAIVDGDNEDTTAATTGATYPRINAYRAVQFVRDAFTGATPPPGPGPDPDPADPNGTIASAIPGPDLTGAAVEAIAGTIGSDGTSTIGGADVDLVRFDVSSPGAVTVTVAGAGATFDSFLRIFNAGGAPVAFDDDSNGDLGSRVTLNLNAGTYYAGVSGAGNSAYSPTAAGSGAAGATGNYFLSFAVASGDPNGLLSGALPLNIGGADGPQVLAGVIGTDFGTAVGSSDVDMFRILIPDDGVLSVDIDTPFGSGFVDSYLRVFDEAGNELVNSDDDRAPDESVDPGDGEIVVDAAGNQVGHRSDSFVGGTVSRGDVYYVAVSDFDNQNYNPSTLAGRSPTGAGGQYNVNVTFVNRDLNGSIPQALTATSLPAAAEGFIGTDGDDAGGIQEVGDRDVDFVRVNSPTAGILEAVVVSTSVENVSPVDTVLRLFDAAGNLLTFDDDTNGLDPVIRYEISAGVDYYVAVAGYGNDNFDPFVLGSGSAGETGAYGFAVGVRPLGDEGSLTDDTVASGGVLPVTLGFRTVASVGEDRGYARGRSDVDLYRFQADGSGSVQILAMPVEDFGGDPFLRLFDAAGNELAFDDNGAGLSRGSRILAQVNPGVYYIGVSGAGASPRGYNPLTGGGAGNGATGEYSLVVDGTLGPPLPTEAPDLAVAGVVAKVKPGAVIGGLTKGSAQVRVTNQGNRPNAGAVAVSLWLSTDGTIDGGDTQIAVLPPKAMKLKVGASKVAKAKFVFPAIADGNYFLLAQADATGLVAETNESNNVGTTPTAIIVQAPFVDFNVSFGPLTITSLAAGQKGKITLLVRNDGNVLTRGLLPVRLIASIDGLLSGDDPLLAPLTAKLNVKPGATKAVRLKFTMPAGVTPGSYFLLASLDSATDRNPANNLAVSPVQVAVS